MTPEPVQPVESPPSTSTEGGEERRSLREPFENHRGKFETLRTREMVYPTTTLPRKIEQGREQRPVRSVTPTEVAPVQAPSAITPQTDQQELLRAIRQQRSERVTPTPTPPPHTTTTDRVRSLREQRAARAPAEATKSATQPTATPSPPPPAVEATP